MNSIRKSFAVFMALIIFAIPFSTMAFGEETLFVFSDDHDEASMTNEKCTCQSKKAAKRNSCTCSVAENSEPAEIAFPTDEAGSDTNFEQSVESEIVNESSTEEWRVYWGSESLCATRNMYTLNLQIYLNHYFRNKELEKNNGAPLINLLDENGIFDMQTQDAVIVFQREEGIPESGIADDVTKHRLFEKTCGFNEEEPTKIHG